MSDDRQVNLTLGIASTEATRMIFDHEEIPYTTGFGPGSTLVTTIAESDLLKVIDVASQWMHASNALLIHAVQCKQLYEDKERNQDQT